jgi:hypothetical protein
MEGRGAKCTKERWIHQTNCRIFRSHFGRCCQHKERWRSTQMKNTRSSRTSCDVYWGWRWYFLNFYYGTVTNLSFLVMNLSFKYYVKILHNAEFYVLLTVHLDSILGKDQLDALFLNVFILCLYMFRAASAHHQEGQIVLIQHLV